MTASLLQTLQAEVGRTYVSDWLLVDQDMIDRFAEVTGDHQFIHVDPERAAKTPFGARSPTASCCSPSCPGCRPAWAVQSLRGSGWR